MTSKEHEITLKCSMWVNVLRYIWGLKNRQSHKHNLWHCRCSWFNIQHQHAQAFRINLVKDINTTRAHKQRHLLVSSGI